MQKRDFYKEVLLGVAVGDALGVPVEFTSRESLQNNPVTDMREYGTYQQPAGTWSDDSSLTFCLAEALTQEFDLYKIAENFVAWAYDSLWTPHGEVFDIGISTRKAIDKLSRGTEPTEAGGKEPDTNGNGSLMRILPLVFELKGKTNQEKFELVQKVSSLTHAHIRSVIACYYYLEFAQKLMDGKDKKSIYLELQKEVPTLLEQVGVSQEEIQVFDRLLKADISELPENEIDSGGYVMHSIEASIWCLLTTENYSEAVLKAVNLGRDTDTTGAITGGLAALTYGLDDIPIEWQKVLARYKDILSLSERLKNKYES
ncbi:ADP-ribosylglycohydrolase family protein [Ornithobacterium rhinotracheale]|uniref:ADP-ribosylglycohydrolase family protein n=1 Tax=Ornithobacterium rhinotracheale TaxID=28251 RepID=UPI00129C193C|nr:ADP-ribosylglycohydrolase family protein [Ornithobacterium rhinotracheale]MRJ09380.1 ADP-ribosylglycohydrolase family protein [Ornithobacterium rhinotracheale]UOH77017.1 ADP-ribosylglycohydrolase family protein [Ornithobacterium rhinotracheale]